MRKLLVAVVVVVSVYAAVMLLAPGVAAQGGGRIERPRLEAMMLQGPGSEIGVSVRELRSDEVTAARPEGVYVQDVQSDSPAARAGLRAGDVVVEFDGERVRSVRQFTRLVRETPPGRAVKTIVMRDGSRQTLDVTPQESRQLSTVLPDISREIERGMRALPRDFNFDLRGFGGPSRLGVTLMPLSDQLAAYFGAKEGVLVSSVEADSAAARAGVRAGDVITTVAGRTVREPADVASAIRDGSAGSAVDIRLLRDKKELTVKATIPERRPSASRNRIPI